MLSFLWVLGVVVHPCLCVSQVVVNISKRYGKLPVSLLALLVVTYTIFGLLRTDY